MAKTITFSGETLKQYILGKSNNVNEEYNTFFDEYYYQGSANRRAQRISALQNENNTVKPIPFRMPSERYYDSYVTRHQQKPYGMSEEEWQEQIAPPNYLINSMVYLGGTTVEATSSINWLSHHTDINISGCTFSEPFNALFFDFKHSLVFTNCLFKGPFICRNSAINNIVFKKCTFDNVEFQVSDSDFNSILFDECHVYSVSVSIDRNPYNIEQTKYINDIDHSVKNINFINTSVTIGNFLGNNIKSIEFDNAKFDELNLDISVKDLYLINKTVDKNRINIKSLNITLEPSAKDTVSIIEGFSIQKFNISGLLRDTTFNIYDIIFNNLLIKNFVNESKLIFNATSLESPGRVEITRSQLGKVEFNYVDFTKADTFRIYLSNITDIITHNTVFSNNIISKDEFDFSTIREIYRQLKSAAGKQSDKVNELRYEALEMEAFKKELIKSNISYDKWILFINEWSNGHG
ncbi:hypothetical protein [Spirosoma agri]|uniref:Uncharacterized protein n=1 Tax=Spirosoma agri TaxID=1987381 RepID=A0A6M0IGV5_9BACT|nr:hypothetical protein [Spirosoma agri]NEU67107.1 hypothetical protein [Spirosoma agri]